MKHLDWSPGMTLESVERQAILAAYAFHKNNKTITSNALGISIRTLDAKLEKYSLDDKKFEEAEHGRKRDQQEWLLRSRGQHPDQIEQSKAKAGLSPKAGNGMESGKVVPAKQDLPLPERKEVQALSPGKITHSDTRKLG